MRKITVLILLAFHFTSFGQTPTQAASNINFTFTGCNEFTVEWTNGNGSDRVVIVREGAALSEVPTYNEYYSYNVNFGGAGAESLNNNDGIHWCVYRGPNNSTTVKGLKKQTTYYVAVFEYNGGGGIYDYKTNSYPTANVTTKNIVADFKITNADLPADSFAQQCLNGNKFKFTNKSTCDKSPMSYLWKFGDGKDTTVSDPIYIYKKAGLYGVRLTVTAPGCVISVTKNDTVHPHPNAKFDLDPALLPKNDTIQCFFKNRFTFRNQCTLLDIGVGLSSMRYEWFDVGTSSRNLFATNYKADYEFPTDGNKKVKLVVISNKGCKDSIMVTKYVVKPRAIDPSKVVFKPKAMCLSNNLFTFINNSPNSISSRWYYHDTISKVNFDSTLSTLATYNFKKIGKYIVTLRAYDNGGCLDEIKDSVVVFKNNVVTFTGLNDEYCQGSPKVILTPKPGKGVFFGTNVSATDSSFVPKDLGKFKVGYASTTGGCTDTTWDSTMVYDNPVLKLGNDTVICKDVPLQLSVDPTLTNIGWFLNNSTSSFSSGSSIQVTQSGLYKVSAKKRNCTSTDEIDIKSLNSPQLSIAFNDTQLCGGSFLDFNIRVDDGTVAWNDGSLLRDRKLSETGYYQILVSNKCGSASDSFNLIVEETACIVFFPNAFSPNGDILNDTWQPYGKYEFVQMHIFNRWGEQVYFSNKSPVWNGYNDKDLCLEGIYNIVFEYLAQDGNTMKRITKGLPVHLIK
jgi:gliding motility-associated-like protein